MFQNIDWQGGLALKDFSKPELCFRVLQLQIYHITMRMITICCHFMFLSNSNHLVHAGWRVPRGFPWIWHRWGRDHINPGSFRNTTIYVLHVYHILYNTIYVLSIVGHVNSSGCPLPCKNYIVVALVRQQNVFASISFKMHWWSRFDMSFWKRGGGREDICWEEKRSEIQIQPGFGLVQEKRQRRKSLLVGHFRGCAVAWGQDHPHHHQHHRHHHSPSSSSSSSNFKIILRAQEKTFKCGGITAEGY